MSDFRESLRHAVLANIVAAANSEFKSTYTAMGIQPIGTMRNSLAVDTLSKEESNGTLFHNEENNSATPPAPPNTAESPKKAKTLTREKERNTISQGLYTPRGFYNANSCLDVNVELANMMNFRTSKNIEIGYKTANVKSLETVSEDHPTLLNKSQRSTTLKSLYDSRFKFNANGEPISSYALCGTGLNNVVTKDYVTSVQVRTEINVSQNVGATNKQKPLSHGSNRSQSEDHQSHFGTKIQTNLTKSEFKTQKEAKCDAINVGDPIASYILYGASQSKDTSRRDCYGATKETARGTPAFDNRKAEYPNNNVATYDPLFLNRETKEINNFDLTEGFKVISLNAEFSTIPKPHTIHTNGQLKLRNKFLDDIQNNTRTWTQENIIANIIPTGEAAHHSVLPSYLDFRQLTTSQSQFTRTLHSGRKSLLGNRRSKSLNIHVRDKLRSISPGTSHNSFDNHTKSYEDFSLVGQSIPSFSSDKRTVKIYNRGLKTPLSERKLESCETDESFQVSCRDLVDNITTQEAPHQTEVVSFTPLTLSDVNHKQKCEDNVVARISPSHTNSFVLTSLRSSQAGKTKMELETRPHRYYTNDITKLNSCFSFTHDSRESVLDGEILTMRSLIDQALEPNYLDLRSFSPRNTVNADQTVPMYMGCSSQVAETVSRSQLHCVINKCGKGTDISHTMQVIKALDPDVYSDYQHKKYRDSNMTTNLNTGLDQPTMHFIKIKVTGDGI